MRIDYFSMHVRLNIEGVEMFGFGPGDPSPTEYEFPLLDIAIAGPYYLRLAHRTGQAKYDFPESGAWLRFQMDGEDVAVELGPDPGRTARTSYASLLDAWEHFADRVREYLSREAPELLDHPFWGQWLRGAEEEDIPWPP